jgi:hypothetical protein
MRIYLEFIINACERTQLLLPMFFKVLNKPCLVFESFLKIMDFFTKC